MKDLLAWFGLKRFPFDKNIKTQGCPRDRTLERMPRPARLHQAPRRHPAARPATPAWERPWP